MTNARASRTGMVFLIILLLPVPSSLAQTDEDESELEHCDQPYGTLAVQEPQEVLYALSRYQLGSPASLIRMMVQESNCFIVVERGVAMRNLQQERELARSGELRQGENIGGGQMEGADYVLTPHVIFSEGNAGGVGGGLGGILRRKAPGIGAIAGGLKFKEAKTSMLVSDVRSSVQVAAAEGQAKARDFRLGALGFGGGAVGALGGYTNTNEGKVIAASFLDNYNNIVLSLRNNSNLSGEPGDGVKAGVVFHEGDILVPKIDNVQVLSTPSVNGEVVAQVKKTDELVFMGEEQDGYVSVQGATAGGWVKKVLVQKQ